VFYQTFPLNLKIPILLAEWRVCLHNYVEICIQQASSQISVGDSGAMRVAMMSSWVPNVWRNWILTSQILVLFGVEGMFAQLLWNLYSQIPHIGSYEEFGRDECGDGVALEAQSMTEGAPEIADACPVGMPRLCLYNVLNI
jgi:hypothetical protein